MVQPCRSRSRTQLQPHRARAACTAALQFPHAAQGKNSDGVSAPWQQPCRVTRWHMRGEHDAQFSGAVHSPSCHAG
jgi:hypothetical protein